MAKTLVAVEEKTCTQCKVMQRMSEFYTTGKCVDGRPKYNSWCKKCISKKMASYHQRIWGKEQLQYTAFRRTKSVRSYLQYLRSKAVQRKKNGDVISIDALELLWATQKGNCALTGWPMTMELANGVVPTNCSLDRINSSEGYVVGNVQLVCRAANIAKHNLSDAEFVNLCRAVLEHANGKL